MLCTLHADYFKHTCFMLLRSLQDISQSYLKCTENTSFIHDNNNDDGNIVIVVIINDDDNDDFENEEKVQF